MTLLEKLNRLPPCVCRLLAENNGELATDHELLLLTGWRRKKLDRISMATTWAEVSISDADDFLRACGLTWSTQRRQLWLLQVAALKGFRGIRRMRHLQKPIAQKAGRVLRLLKRVGKIMNP
jgi:hypothetical protein